jgi:hypothetical protein
MTHVIMIVCGNRANSALTAHDHEDDGEAGNLGVVPHQVTVPNPEDPGSAPRRDRVPPGPVLPEQSREDTDAGWGEYPETGDDHLYRDRPPHWDDF